jgi:hypothetical protein
MCDYLFAVDAHPSTAVRNDVVLTPEDDDRSVSQG